MSTAGLTSMPTFRDIVGDLLAILRRQTRAAGEGWNGATTIEQAGIDSLELEEVILNLEDKYSVRVNFNRKMSEPTLATVDDVARLMQDAIAQDAGRKISRSMMLAAGGSFDGRTIACYGTRNHIG